MIQSNEMESIFMPVCIYRHIVDQCDCDLEHGLF